MPSFMPTSIPKLDRIPTSDAALLSQAYQSSGINPKDLISLLDSTLGKAQRAKVAEENALAIDAATRALQSGRTWNEAVAGLDPRITGGSDFRDAILKTTQDIRENSSDNRLWNERLQSNKESDARIRNSDASTANILEGIERARRSEEAKAYLADLQRFRLQTKGENLQPWTDKNLPYLRENNPEGYALVMNAISEGNGALNIPTPTREWTPDQVDALQHQLLGRSALIDRAMTEFDPNFKQMMSDEYKDMTVNKFMDKKAKDSGDYGSKGFFHNNTDLRENLITTAFNQLRKVARDTSGSNASLAQLPDAAVWMVMDKYFDAANLPNTQDSIDISAAAEELRNLRGSYAKNWNTWRSLSIEKNNVDTASSSIFNVQQELRKRAAYLNEAVKLGVISSKDAEKDLNILQNRINDALNLIGAKQY